MFERLLCSVVYALSDDTLRDVNILLGEKTVYVDRIYVDVKDHFCVY